MRRVLVAEKLVARKTLSAARLEHHESFFEPTVPQQSVVGGHVAVPQSGKTPDQQPDAGNDEVRQKLNEAEQPKIYAALVLQ